jgi:hypothetical protein
MCVLKGFHGNHHPHLIIFVVYFYTEAVRWGHTNTLLHFSSLVLSFFLIKWRHTWPDDIVTGDQQYWLKLSLGFKVVIINKSIIRPCFFVNRRGNLPHVWSLLVADTKGRDHFHLTNECPSTGHDKYHKIIHCIHMWTSELECIFYHNVSHIDHNVHWKFT